jgi:hypothetical protein
MNKRYVVAAWVMALAVPAMAKDLATSLPGNWTIDKAAAFEAMAPPFYKMATPEKQKEILADAMKSVPDMSVEFTATTASMKSGSEAPQVATYKVTKQDQKTVWADMVPKKKDGSAGAAEKFTFEFVDPNTVKMLKEGDPAALLLHRAK